MKHCSSRFCISSKMDIDLQMQESEKYAEVKGLAKKLLIASPWNN